MADVFRLSALLIPLTLLVAGCSAPADSGPLALGELYQAYEDTSGGATPASTYYLKFLDEGTVLNTQSEQPPEQVRGWFHRGEPNVGSEDYELDGNVVTITRRLWATRAKQPPMRPSSRPIRAAALERGFHASKEELKNDESEHGTILLARVGHERPRRGDEVLWRVVRLDVQR